MLLVRGDFEGIGRNKIARLILFFFEHLLGFLLVVGGSLLMGAPISQCPEVRQGGEGKGRCGLPNRRYQHSCFQKHSF